MARRGQRIQNNKFAMSMQYLKKELSYEVDVSHVRKHESLLQVDSIIFYGFGQHAQIPNYPGKSAISFWLLKKEVVNEARDLWFKYYSYNLLYLQCSPTIQIFLSQYGIHNKPFLHLINCLCIITTLLFEVMVGSWKLAR